MSDITAAALANCGAYLYDEDSEGNFVEVENFLLSGGGSESALFSILLALELGIGDDGLNATITAAALGLCTQILHTASIEDFSEVIHDCYWVVVDGTRYGSKDNQDICEDDPPRVEDLPDDNVEPIPDEPDPTEVRVYRGQVEFHLVAADWSNDPPIFLTKTCDTTPDAELIVRPDGTLTFTFAWIQWVRNSGFSAPTENDCQPWERNSVFEGTWTGTTFTATIGDPLHLNPVEFEGQLAENCSVGLGRLCAVAQAELAFYGVAVSGTYGGNTGTLSFALPLVNE